VRPDVYTRTIRRAYFKQNTNDFMARPLNADDKRIIEHIREKGCWDTPLNCWHSFVDHNYPDEEHDYWKKHWAEEPGITRRYIPPPTPEELAVKARRRTEAAETRRLNRIAVAGAREEAFREWQAEQQRQLEEREKRILRNMLAQEEWERAETLQKAVRDARVVKGRENGELYITTTHHLDYRKPAPQAQPHIVTDDNNRYVPEWKLEEHGWVSPQKIASWRWKLTGLLARLEQQREAIQHARYEAHEAAASQERAAMRAANREALRESARREWTPQPPEPIQYGKNVIAEVQRRILKTIRGTRKQWTVEELMKAIDFNDYDLVTRCADALAGGGYIGSQRAA